MSGYEDLAENYGHCYGKNELPFGKKAVLLVIDAVAGYLTPGCPLYAPVRFEEARQSIVRMIESCRAIGIPVVFSSVCYSTKNGNNGGNWYKYKLPQVLNTYDEGNPYREFAEGCEPLSSEIVVIKQYSSSFFGTCLPSILQGLGCDTLVCCGYSTSGCVRATVLDAMQHGFNPYVVRDACGDRHATVNDNSLFDMQQKFSEVRSEAEILALLEKNALKK
ncbi:hypothetical protein SEUCBS139899_007634 [Sporothrix eucalyptigena]|uniref:Isochorismatase-like domain-containing protein n=1 Tax=Sporothrix eucalyptigena TaxID=1812306 RepID=A0ABP0AT48_9PEZI